MADRTIPQRELRNNIGEILREAEAGTEFTITIHGRPVARLGPHQPAGECRRDLDAGTVARLLGDTPVDSRFAEDVSALRRAEAAVDDPWPGE
ncbi:MAG TPA: type II toxin-antitoxin system prevent-host-death family antitoxin [Solirubrobacteraceae bacterium]|jgi:prevent-host-death family protein